MPLHFTLARRFRATETQMSVMEPRLVVLASRKFLESSHRGELLGDPVVSAQG